MTAPLPRDTSQPAQPQTVWAGLGTRVLSSLVLAAAALAAVHGGGLWYLAMLAVLALLLLYEWAGITGTSIRSVPAVVQAGAVLGAIAAVWIDAYPLSLALISVATLVLMVPVPPPRPGRLWVALAVPYIGLPCLALTWLRHDGGSMLVYWVLATVWATDTGAYLVGRLVGGPRLAPRISPKKTWAGLAGGAVAAALAGLALAAPGDALPWAGASVVLGLWSQVGDLCESAIKRHFGVKDSSRLIPGHGGFFDRVDGLLFAAPLAALAVAGGVL